MFPVRHRRSSPSGHRQQPSPRAWLPRRARLAMVSLILLPLILLLPILLLLVVMSVPGYTAPPETSASGPRPRAAASTAAVERRPNLSAARSWAYQLRIRDLAPLAATDADLLVIDHGYAARHDGKLLFDPQDLAPLKRKPDGGRRAVLAYLSIGEAEQYRYYWQGAWCRRATAPAWIGAVNPNWPGNYPVRFWDPAWQRLILDPVDGYLARIQAQGFDGIYLDRADVYAEWLDERPTAERDMIVFLQRIATAARAGDPHFLVVMQNAEELLARRAVRRLLDAVAKEDLLHGLAFTEADNDQATIDASLVHLKRLRADGKPVFTVEYLTDPVRIDTARRRHLALGFVPTFAPRLLDRLGVAAAPAEPTPVPAATLLPSGTAMPAPPAPVASPAPPWGEGGPTCLVD